MIEPDAPLPAPAFQRTDPWTLYGADLLSWAGLALYALYVVGLLPALVPVRLQDPAWLQATISALIVNAVFPLIGTCLLVLARFVAPGDTPGQTWLRRFQRWAWIAVVGYLLLIPLQVYALVQLERAAERPLLAEMRVLRSTITEVRASRSIEGLAPVLARLPGSPRIPPGFSVPFQTFRSQVLDTLTANEARLDELRARQGRERFIPQLVRGLHTALSSLILAVAFSAAGRSRILGVSLLRHRMGTAFRPRDAKGKGAVRVPQGVQDREYLDAILPEEDS